MNEDSEKERHAKADLAPDQPLDDKPQKESSVQDEIPSNPPESELEDLSNTLPKPLWQRASLTTNCDPHSTVWSAARKTLERPKNSSR